MDLDICQDLVNGFLAEKGGEGQVFFGKNREKGLAGYT